jgi:nucleoside-diphosphate-sugar epimerase
MGERILVTGGAGYIGTVMVPMLLEAGHSVTVLARFGEGDAVLACCCRYEGFVPIKGDARDETLVKSLVAKADVIMPLAALVGAPICKIDPLNAVTTNRDAVVTLTRLVSKNQKMVFATTNSGYGVGQRNKFCTEETPLNPVSLYGTTKCEAEAAILNSGNGITLRLATVFGMSPRMRTDLLVNDFTHRAVTDRTVVIFEGHFRRNYVHIRDVAKAFMHAVSNYAKMNNNAYNVGLSGANLSKLELCECIQKIVPSFIYLEAPVGEDPDKRDYIVSNDKLEATGWTPDWSLERGIHELVKGYTMMRNRRFSNV